MLETLREMSIKLWSPVGEIFSSIFGTSNIWFPIISYILGTIIILIIIKKILDMTVTGFSSLNMSIIWVFIKKLLLYGIIIGVGLTLVVTLYFYLTSIYNKYNPDVIKKEQSLDYLLHMK